MRETTNEQRKLLETKTPLTMAAVAVDIAVCNAVFGAGETGPSSEDEVALDRALADARAKLDEVQRAWARYWQSRRAA